MGCASSKQSRKRCRSCQAPYSPMPRSYSMHVIHPPQQKGDNYHLVALTSTTLGSLHLDDDDPPSTNSGITGDFSMDLIEAKTWSSMIENKIPKIPNPKTPNMTPPGEPETINTWELMEGLDEDYSPCRSSNHVRSFSFDVTRDPNCGELLGGNMISVVRKSMEELSPSHPFHLKPIQGKERVVVYFTSLRGVRKTYEDSCDVRVILKGLGVRVDERDVSMHSGFKEELRQLLGGGVGGFSLPRVFISGKYVGGADEIRRLHEEGSLEKAVQGCEKAVDDGGGEGGMCEGCGDVRFVPCETCSGSCKIYYEEEEEEDDDDEDDDTDVEEGNEVDYGFQRCPDCNENGLIRCPICCFL
ncbi:Uncharacterized protein At5g39865 [Linum grandiflorum]